MDRTIVLATFRVSGIGLRWRQRVGMRHGSRGVIVCDVEGSPDLIEFPAEEPDRALRFW